MYKIIGADGKEYGPVSLDQLKEWIVAGRVNSQSRIQKEGTADWRPAAEFPEVAALLPPPMPTGVSPRVTPPPAIGPLPSRATGNNALAITSFVLGLVSVVLCLLALAGVPAVICGHIARRQIRAAGPAQRGAGLALAGLILGYIGIAFTLMLPAMLLPALAKAKERATAIHCSNNMKQIGLAFQMWATDNSDKFPFQVSTNSGGTMELREAGKDGTDANSPLHLAVLGKYLGTTKVLVCPADHGKVPAPNFDNLQPQNVSYRLNTDPEATPGKPNTTLATCPVHGITLRCDGSVQMKQRRTPWR